VAPGVRIPPLRHQFVGLADIWEDAAILRVDGLVRAARGTGESEQFYKGSVGMLVEKVKGVII
jgi:hypothetical protein